ncbi:MAG: hypothetical protein M1830_008885 [Pleopsidium flavum]|nr:MAG: hypothetical protein M1830_008885 [Pleopsidium flavum]
MPSPPSAPSFSLGKDPTAAILSESTAAGKGSLLSQNGSEERDESGNEASSHPSLIKARPNTSRTKPPNSKWRRYLSTVKWFLLDQWFVVALGCLILISPQVQVPGSQQSKKELVVTYLCVSVIFIVTGCTLPTRVLVENYARWKVHLFVQGQSFLMTSAIVYAVVSLCATNRNFLDPGLMVGMIFTGCVPTTISSNVVMTKKAHGNQALTVVQSTLGNFLGPFLTPLLIEMYIQSGAWYTQILPRTRAGGFGELYQRVFMQLGLSIFLPLVVGQIIQNIFPKPTKKIFIDWKINKIGSLSLLIIIWQTFDQAFQSGAFRSLKGVNMVFIVFISNVYYAIWMSICVLLSLPWLQKKDTIAVAYCVPAKTPAMGVPLSVVMFSGLSTLTKSKIQIPMVIFQGFQIAAGSLMTLVFRRWIRPGEEREDAEKAQHGNGVTKSG